MNLLVDENIHSKIVVWLRNRGHDVLYAAESLSSRSDDELLRIAREQGRTLVSEDKDFGELVFLRRLVSHGVILIRLGSPTIEDRIARLSEVWPDIESKGQPVDKFIVISNQTTRIRSLPPTI